MLAIIWLKAVILTFIWMFGIGLYLDRKGYPNRHPYNMMVYGPFVLCVTTPVISAVIYWLIFVW